MKGEERRRNDNGEDESEIKKRNETWERDRERREKMGKRKI